MNKKGLAMSSLSEKKKYDKYFCFYGSMFPFDISKFVTILTHRKTQCLIYSHFGGLGTSMSPLPRKSGRTWERDKLAVMNLP